MSKQSFLGIFPVGLKHIKITKVIQKMAKTIKMPYYLSHFIKKNPLFDVDVFSRTFDMESPLGGDIYNGAKHALCLFLCIWQVTTNI